MALAAIAQSSDHSILQHASSYVLQARYSQYADSPATWQPVPGWALQQSVGGKPPQYGQYWLA